VVSGHFIRANGRLGVTAPVMLNLGDKCWKVVKLQAAASLPTVHIELEISGETFPLCSMNSALTEVFLCLFPQL